MPYDEAAAAYDDAPDQVRVQPSIPILYFGDLQRYMASPLKIITVALNPSSREFPPERRFKRFPAAAGINGVGIPPTAENHEALDDYFRNEPYMSWFNCLKPVLSGFGASFFSTPENENTALHTDLLSPVATDPTWSKLEEQYQEQLASRGVPLWHNLVKKLCPDIILVSVAQEHIERIEFLRNRNLAPVWTFPDKPPVQHAVVSINGNHSADLIFAQAKRKPFGVFTDVEQRLIGEHLMGGLGNW